MMYTANGTYSKEDNMEKLREALSIHPDFSHRFMYVLVDSLSDLFIM